MELGCGNGRISLGWNLCRLCRVFLRLGNFAGGEESVIWWWWGDWLVVGMLLGVDWVSCFEDIVRVGAGSADTHSLVLCRGWLGTGVFEGVRETVDFTCWENKCGWGGGVGG